ncbi:hypothetical protein I2I11_20900 [Pontibacter sp. 172403-2]|uniref:hypothetical protein n=1 Tax=Pontibacter rufus TaxID=2791028 RepID=UPI0018AF8B54|nr:hypothetical protein [Pontibacter sp. 172403-2]MBF9255770.1 hypothetical protein [Pontibacter sp. 172403-2]
MDKNKSIILVLALAVTALFSFKQYEQAAPKETMTLIVSNRNNNMLVNISTTGSSSRFEQRRVKAESDHDYSGALQIIKEQQAKGWQIKSSNYATSLAADSDQDYYLYFLLEK